MFNSTVLKTNAFILASTLLIFDIHVVSSFTSHTKTSSFIIPGTSTPILSSNRKHFQQHTKSPLSLLSTATDQLEKVVTSTEPPAAVAEPPSKSYLDDGFVFGLEGSGLERPKGKVSQIVVEGDSLETTPTQVAIVAATFINHALVAMYAITQLNTLNEGNAALSGVESILCIFSSWVLADLGSGILHWSVDNYGNGRTPIMGNIIAAFQGHHTAPWTITERGFCNNVYKLCVPFGIPTVGAIAFLAGPTHPLGTYA